MAGVRLQVPFTFRMRAPPTLMTGKIRSSGNWSGWLPIQKAGPFVDAPRFRVSPSPRLPLSASPRPSPRFPVPYLKRACGDDAAADWHSEEVRQKIELLPYNQPDHEPGLHGLPWLQQPAAARVDRLAPARSLW